MDTNQIDAFLLAAEHLSFSEAAKILYTTQPSISRRISALEEEVGKQLFLRKQNSIVLTRAGEILYDELVQVRFSLESAMERIRKSDSLVVAKLRIGCMELYDYGVCLPPELCQKMQQDYPEVQMTFVFSSIGNLRTMLLQDELDLIITFDWDLEEIPDLSDRRLFSVEPVFIIGKRHPLAERACRPDFSPREFSDERFFVLSDIESSGRVRAIQTSTLPFGFVPKSFTYCYSHRSMMEYIYQGLGVTVVDNMIKEAKSPDFITIPTNEGEIIHIVAAKKAKNKNLLIDSIMEMLSDHFQHS